MSDGARGCFDLVVVVDKDGDVSMVDGELTSPAGACANPCMQA